MNQSREKDEKLKESQKAVTGLVTGDVLSETK